METEELKKYIQAGKIAAQALEYGKNLIKPGEKMIDVSQLIEQKIVDLGAAPAFPVTISCDAAAAHDTPTPKDERRFDSQVVKLDVGVHVDGFVGGDTASTIDLSGNYTDLVKASKEALDAAIKITQIGTKLGDIGKEIEQTIQSFGFEPVRNLSGHGLGKWSVHQAPSIPNYNTKEKTELEKDMTIAIEPFASTGVGLIVEKGVPNIHNLDGKKPVRNIITRQILKKINTTLPFANRWLTKDIPEFKVNFALKELDQLGILKSYPPLVEKTPDAIISHAEHSLYIGDKVIILTKPD